MLFFTPLHFCMNSGQLLSQHFSRPWKSSPSLSPGRSNGNSSSPVCPLPSRGVLCPTSRQFMAGGKVFLHFVPLSLHTRMGTEDKTNYFCVSESPWCYYYRKKKAKHNSVAWNGNLCLLSFWALKISVWCSYIDKLSEFSILSKLFLGSCGMILFSCVS